MEELYSNYNKIYLIYKESRYLHYSHDGKYVNIVTNQIGFNHLIYQIVQQLFHLSKPNVFFYYHYIINSIFLNKKQILEVEFLYQKIQKFKFGFARFKHIIRLKYKKKFNTTNLLFEPLPSKTIQIYENNKIYQFSDIEMHKMIENCFNYISYDVPTILKLKNPYTNIEFSFYNLIYIYFELIKHGKNSVFFTLYFKSNFNKRILLDIYQPQLYINCLTKTYNNLTITRKRTLLYQMINYNKKYKHFNNVNYDLLYCIFNKQVKYYYIHKKLLYNFSDEEYESLIQYYENMFLNKLEKVYKKNHAFGRKTFRKNIFGKYEYFINEMYLNI